MDHSRARPPRSHGTGELRPEALRDLGDGVVFEPGVLVFHPENVRIGDHVYVGHGTMLKAYHTREMSIGAGTWIGQRCFFHSAGGIRIGRSVGIGPGVTILTSQHDAEDVGLPVLHAPLEFAPVVVEDGADIGANSTVLPGVTIGAGAIVGAGAVVNRDVPPFAVVAGVPARFIRDRRDA